MNLPNDAKMLISLFEQNGHTAYAVGGCVRDALMGVAEKDIDITTSATPEQTEQILANNGIKFIETGIKHGTVTALVNHIPYEITTFRTEGKYADNRHPDSVNFVDDVTLDLARRDFTMNAIAYNDTVGFVDCFGGVDDIKNKIIRAVGDPDKRFEEDALRIMRCIRFASVLGFDVEKHTSRAVHDNKDLLKNIAVERIYVELIKLLMGKNCEQVLLEYKDVIGVIIPELVPTFDCRQVSKWHIYDVYTHIAKSVAVAPKKDYIRLALLFHDIAKPQTKTTDENGNDHFKFHGFEGEKITATVLKRLKVSNDVFNKVTMLVKYHDDHITTKHKNIKKWLRVFGEDMIFDYIDLKIADLSTHNLTYSQEEIDNLYKIREITAQVIASGEPYRVSDLAITGKDLIEIGYKGHEIAEELDALVKIVSGDPNCNTKEKLIHQAVSDIKNNA